MKKQLAERDFDSAVPFSFLAVAFCSVCRLEAISDWLCDLVGFTQAPEQ